MLEHRPQPAALCAALLTLTGSAAAVAQEASPVSVVSPQRVTLSETRRLTGTVTAARTSALSPRIAGLVAEITVDAGDRVEDGAVILRLDDELARLERERSVAALTEGKARLAEAERLSREATELARQKTLPATQAEAAAAAARISASTMASLEASARLQQAVLRRHLLPAPFAGVVTARHADVGEWVQNGDAVIDLVALEDLRFDVRAPQELYPLLAQGDAATVRLDALPGEPLEGHIAARVPLADAATRSFLVRIGFDGLPPAVIPGMSGEARIGLSRKQEGWALPRDALVSYPDGTRSVWLVEERDGRSVAAARRVRTGRAVDGLIEVTEGISGGERVIIRGNEGLRDNQPVRVVDRQATTR